MKCKQLDFIGYKVGIVLFDKNDKLNRFAEDIVSSANKDKKCCCIIVYLKTLNSVNLKN